MLAPSQITRSDAEDWAAWFRALADPTRLRVLVEAGYVLQQRDGTTTRVSVNPDCLAELPGASRAILAG